MVIFDKRLSTQGQYSMWRGLVFPRPYAWIVLVAVVTAACSQADGIESLGAELLEMGRRDQAVRERMIGLIQEEGEDALASEQFKALASEQAAIDESNFVRLEEIVTEYGWPTAELVGEQANGIAWLILEHASLERQRQYLVLLREAVSRGRASGAKLASLEDEVAIADHGEQIYGTEIKMDLIDGTIAVAPIADPGRLNERRARLGLPTMEEYLQKAEAELGVTIDRSALSGN